MTVATPIIYMATVLLLITPEIMGAITGSMLSDGHIGFAYPGARNARFRLTQCTANLSLVQYFHTLLAE
jgi:hypothetical protein